MSVSRERLESAIRQAWSQETSASPDEWDATSNPERGQCVPSSLVVQDYLGGEIERLATEYQGTRETHYRNRVDDDEDIVDLTRSQYPQDQAFEAAPIPGDTREYVLGNDRTRHRYVLLASTVEKLLTLDEASTER